MVTLVRHLSALMACIILFAAPAVAQNGLQIVGVNGGSIAHVDLVSGNAADTHAITVPGKTMGQAYGVARDPQTGTVYAIVSYSTGGGRHLITVDPANGAGAEVGLTPIVTDIATGADGTLYATGGNFGSGGLLYTLNKSTGAGTALAQLSAGSGHTLASNADDGLLYHGATACDNFCAFYIESFDPQSPAAPPIPVASFTDLGIESGSMVHLRGPFFLVGDVFNLQVVLLNAATGKADYLSSDSWWSGLTTIPAGASCAATTLYATGPFEGPSLLHGVDPVTGAATLIGPVGFNDITGIDFASDGVLYAVGRRADDSGVEVLLTIDPCTGQGTEVGPTGTTLREMVAAPGGGLYAYAGQNFSQIDRVTGAASTIGNSGITADDFGLEYSPTDDQLYFATIFNAVGTLYTIDPATGASAVVSPLTLPANITTLRAMDFNPGNNTMYALIADSAFPGTTKLATVDTASHVVSSVAPTSRFTTLAFKNGTPSANYQLTVIKDGTGNGTVTSAPAGIDCGATCDLAFPAGTDVTLTAVADAGMRFDGWSGACSGTGACVVKMSAMRTVRPRFTQVYHLHLQYGAANLGVGGKVTVTEAIGTQVCLLDQGPCDLLVSAGSVLMHAEAGPGGVFKMWETVCDGGDPAIVDCAVTISADKTVGVDFLGATRLTVTVVTGDSGAFVHDDFDEFFCAGANTCSFDYPVGSTVTLFAEIGGGSTFTGWSGDCTGTGACQVMMSSAHNVTATFALRSFPLNVALAGTGSGRVTGTGINCPGTCSVSNPFDSTLTLTAAAAPESSFAGWSGACSGTAECQVTFNTATNVTANFTLVGPFQFGTKPPPVTVPAGQAATFNLPIQRDAGSNGSILFTCASGLPSGAACSFTPNNIPFTVGTNTPVNTQLTITTTARTVAMLNEPGGLGPIWATSVFALIFCVPRRRRKYALLTLVVALLAFLPACGGGGQSTTTPTKTQSGTQAGSYTVTINGTTGPITKTTTVNLVVQ